MRALPRKAIVLLASMLMLIGVAVVVWLIGRPAGRNDEILVVLKTLTNPYYVEMKRGVDEVTSTLPKLYTVNVEAFDREDNVDGQIAAIRTAMNTGKLIAVSIAPASSTDLAPIVAELNAASIKVIVLDTKLDSAALAQAGAHYDAFIGSDNYAGGEEAARFISKNVNPGPARVLMLEGVPSQETAMSRKNGFLDYVKAKSLPWTVISQVANWNREDGRAATAAVLGTMEVPQAIFGCNDEMALGAIAALRAHGVGRDQWPVIVGFDATSDAIRACKDGVMAKTVEQQPYVMGKEAISLAVALGRGQEVQKDRLIPVVLRP